MKTFFISDTHFGQASILTFKDSQGNLIRPGFGNVQEMDDFIVDQWNKTVGPDDLVYHIGDVAMRKSAVRTIGRCNGRKKLIRGNHDIEKAKFFLEYFEDILGVLVMPSHNLIFSHYPIHPGSLWAYRAETYKINCHGHTHVNDVKMVIKKVEFPMTVEDVTVADPRYINLSVEKHNYTPISFDQLLVQVESHRALIDQYKQSNVI